MNIRNRKEKSIADIVFFDVARRVSFSELLRSALIFTTAPGLIIFLFFINGYIGFYQGIALFSFIFILSILFIHPYIADLKELRDYVNELTIDKNPKKPDLSFLNNIRELSTAIENLNSSWVNKQNHLNELLEQEKQIQIMLTDFIANASHELKTPLTSLSGFLETIENDNNLTPEQKDFIGIMRSQSERMRKLISDLLTLSMAQSSKSKENFEVIDLREITEAALAALPATQDKKINFKTDMDFSSHKIIGNRDEVMRVIENLLSNAIKYSFDDGNVMLKLFSVSNSKYLFNRFDDKADLVGLSVIDEGEGIDEKNIPRLTERFFRIDKARSRKVGGSGLGLAIVKQILDNHNAQFQVKSQLGKGSEFNVFFEAV